MNNNNKMRRFTSSKRRREEEEGHSSDKGHWQGPKGARVQAVLPRARLGALHPHLPRKQAPGVLPAAGVMGARIARNARYLTHCTRTRVQGAAVHHHTSMPGRGKGLRKLQHQCALPGRASVLQGSRGDAQRCLKQHNAYGQGGKQRPRTLKWSEDHAVCYPGSKSLCSVHVSMCCVSMCCTKKIQVVNLKGQKY